MARNRSRRLKPPIRQQRESFLFSRIPDRLLSSIKRVKNSSDKIGGDLRRFKPDLDFNPTKINGGLIAYVEKSPKNNNKRSFVPGRIAFADPKRVTVCVRRKQRRSVLFASGAAGSGKKIYGPRRRGRYSDIKC